MSFKKSLAVATGGLSLLLVALALFNPQSMIVRNLPFISNEANSISGLPGSDGPVLVVKIDDTKAAHPQVGLEDADLVYIEQVEGGLTRLAAVFSSKIPDRIGPVRSARISDIELLQQFGRVGFAYSGAQTKFRPVLHAANLENLGAENHSSSIYTQDPNRTPPYAMVLRADLLMSFVREKGIALATSKQMGWNFGGAPKGGISISSAHISWPASSYDVQWSKEQNTWLLRHGGEADMAESGIQLKADTFVIQLVSITDSIYHDKVGGITPFSATVGEGVGYILRDGRFFKAQWSRPDADSGTSWSTLNGEAIDFKSGRIWIALTDREPKFTHIGADAGASTSK